MRLMYDGVSSYVAGIAQDFPKALLVAGYVDGAYAWSASDWGLFVALGVPCVTIATRASTNAGDVLDVESGDAVPTETGPWIAMRKAAGLAVPSVYCSLSRVPAVRQGTGRFVLGTDYDIWVALYDGSSNAPAVPGPGVTEGVSFAAKQFVATASHNVSAVYDDRWPRRCGLWR